MKKKDGLKISLFLLMGSMLLLLSACKNNNTVTDREGNEYKTIVVGDQVWMAENLDVSTFRNGDSIPEAKSEAEWKKYGENSQPAWCYYGNDKTKGKIYAKLYNWYAVNDPRGIAPAGWHLPVDAEWRTLIDNFGGESKAGENMKSTSGWENGGNGINKSGFQGFPGGHCLFDGRFEDIGKGCYWWSATTTDFNSAFACITGSLNNMVIIFPEELPRGLSVRCIRDNSPVNANSSVPSEKENLNPIPREAVEVDTVTQNSGFIAEFEKVKHISDSLKQQFWLLKPSQLKLRYEEDNEGGYSSTWYFDSLFRVNYFEEQTQQDENVGTILTEIYNSEGILLCDLIDKQGNTTNEWIWLKQYKYQKIFNTEKSKFEYHVIESVGAEYHSYNDILKGISKADFQYDSDSSCFKKTVQRGERGEFDSFWSEMRIDSTLFVHLFGDK